MSRTEVLFKKQQSNWDRLRRECAFLTRHGTTTSGIYRWIFGYDPGVAMARHLSVSSGAGVDLLMCRGLDAEHLGKPRRGAARCFSIEAANSAAVPGNHNLSEWRSAERDDRRIVQRGLHIGARYAHAHVAGRSRA